MAVTETQRLDLHTHFQETMGRERAAVMMELLPPVGWGDVATKQDLATAIAPLATREDLAGVKAELKIDMANLKSDLLEKLDTHFLAMMAINLTFWGLCVAVVTLLR